MIVDVDEERNKVKLHYVGWQEKWDLWCNIGRKCNHIRFCRAGTISTRRIYRSEFREQSDLRNVSVQCRLARYWFESHPNVECSDYNLWRAATIKRVDKHSGQCQLVVRIGSKDYLWWTHLDSKQEVRLLN